MQLDEEQKKEEEQQNEDEKVLEILEKAHISNLRNLFGDLIDEDIE